MPVFTTALQGSASGLAFLSILSNGDSTTQRPQYSFSALTSPSLNFPCFARNSFPFKRFSACIPKVTVSDDSGGITEVAEQRATSRTLKESPDDIQARRSADWKAATAYYERGIIYKGRIEGFNVGGLLVRFYFLIGFLPFPQLSPSHSCREPLKSIQDIAKDLVGSLIYVKVIRADEDNRQLIFSEKEAVWSKLSPQVNIGDIFDGRVGFIEDYGAFVHLRFPDGFYHLTGLVHVSEISWDLIQDIRDILREGEEVRVKVVKVDWEKSRIALSIKQLEEDPLLETLDKVIPQNGLLGPDFSTASDDYDIEPLPGLETIMEELLLEDGIRDIRISRQGFEKRVVSPDLQLWLSNAPAIGDQFTLLARAGRQVQEIIMRTSLDQEGIKAALQRVLERVP